MRTNLNLRKIVIKIGSQSLVNNDNSINESKISELIEQIKILVSKGKEVVLVTSGAIAVGMNKLDLKTKPKNMALKQACAALGQASLMGIYEKYFVNNSLLCAQILVNHDDFSNRKRMVNLKNTLFTLMQQKIIAVINENDALAVDEIKVGDNDTLAAFIVGTIQADLLILLSDIDGLYDKNPKEYNDAQLVKEVMAIDKDIENMIGKKKTLVGTGGMETKIKAARIATNAGCHMVITNANKLSSIEKIIDGEDIGTWFFANKSDINLKEHWLIFDAYATGSIKIDDGAKNAVLIGRSLLPSGIIQVDGNFFANAIVLIKDINDNIIAKGQVNYSSLEIDKIKGLNSPKCHEVLGYKAKDEVVHADNMVILEGKNYGKIK